ncbi:MAG TPA: hypothetical protein VFP88_02185, partial [Rhodanobacteraceae bacterium]|nr:hypothetical protein [Rhodanobacteraceae bacterium]
RTLDEHPDGGTYGRTVAAYLNANRPVTDFADAFHRNKNQDNIGAGATYGQTALTDLYSSGGVSRVGLRVGGSGHRLGDQTNTPSSLSRGYGAVRSATALTAHSTGAVDVNAHTLTIGTAAISYSAHTNAVTGLSQGSTYYIYTRDNYAGGSPTVLSTTSAQTANSFDDAYIFGSITIPASGDSGGGPSGGGGQCVGVNMFVRGSLRAKDVQRRAWLWMARRGRCFPGFQSERLTFTEQPCVRVVAEDGYELECSISTPFDLRDGSMTFARDMYGREVLTRDRFGRKRWRKVIDVVGIGLHPVAHIHAGGRSYAAGARKGHLIYSHNPVK